MGDLPEGFEPHFRKSDLTAPWEPLYSKQASKSVIIALRAGPQHCNSRGFVHGGLIMSLADNAMGLSCGKQHDAIGGLVTSTMNVEFLASCKQGQWIEFVTLSTKIGRRLDAAQGEVRADGSVCAFMSDTFSVLSK